MNTKNINGFISTSAIIASFLGVMFIAASAFGIWAFTEREKYSKDFDVKVSEKADLLRQQIESEVKSDFDIKEQQPYKSFSSDPEYGSITVDIPKNWSILSDKPSKSGVVLDVTMHPDIIPGAGANVPYAARLSLVSDDYSAVVKAYDEAIKKSAVTVSAYRATGVEQSITGIKIDGQIMADKTGTMVILKVRDKTLKIWNESSDNRVEFEQVLLSSLSYNP